MIRSRQAPASCALQLAAVLFTPPRVGSPVRFDVLERLDPAAAMERLFGQCLPPARPSENALDASCGGPLEGRSAGAESTTLPLAAAPSEISRRLLASAGDLRAKSANNANKLSLSPAPGGEARVVNPLSAGSEQPQRLAALRFARAASPSAANLDQGTAAAPPFPPATGQAAELPTGSPPAPAGDDPRRALASVATDSMAAVRRQTPAAKAVVSDQQPCAGVDAPADPRVAGSPALAPAKAVRGDPGAAPCRVDPSPVSEEHKARVSRPPVRAIDDGGAGAGAKTRLVTGLADLNSLFSSVLAKERAPVSGDLRQRPSPVALSDRAVGSKVGEALRPVSLPTGAGFMLPHADGGDESAQPASAAAFAASPPAPPCPFPDATQARRSSWPAATLLAPMIADPAGDEILLDRLLERWEERLREQAIRQLGFTGGLS